MSRTLLEGQYYDLILAAPVHKSLKERPLTFQIWNKEYHVVEDEGPNEISARIFHAKYEEMKADFKREGIEFFLAQPQLPEIFGQ